MKKVISVVLFIVFTWGAIAVWNWADVLAETTQTNAQLFDAIASFLLLLAIVFTCVFNDEQKKSRNAKRKDQKAEIEASDK